MKTPDVQGPHGQAWKFDLDAMARTLHRPEHASLDSWKITAPWAHPLWDSYALFVIHLRPVAGAGEPRIYVPGATHEMMLYALEPGVDVPLDSVPWRHCLQPVNFCAQWTELNDLAAQAKIEMHVREICDGKLSPDTDWTQAWIRRFNAGMFKGDPARVGETIIRTKLGAAFREVVHDPKPADGLPDLNPPWLKDKRGG